MALPGSGTITMNQIRSELGIPSQAPFSLVTAKNGGYVPLNPYSPSLPTSNTMSAWYNYCHACTPLYTHTVYIFWNKDMSGFTSASAACTGNRDYPITVYSSSSSLAVGSSLYTLSGGVYYPFYIYTNFWVWDATGSKPIRINSGANTVAETSNCVACLEYYNPQSYDLYITGNNCSGVAFATWVAPGQSICVQDGSGGGDIGFMYVIGNC